MECLDMLRLLCHPFGDKVKHGAFHITRRILLQTGNNQILFIDNRTVIQRLLFGQHTHQGGFPRSVASDQTDTLIFFDMHLRIFQQRSITECEPGARHINQRHNFCYSSPAWRISQQLWI